MQCMVQKKLLFLKLWPWQIYTLKVFINDSLSIAQILNINQGSKVDTNINMERTLQINSLHLKVISLKLIEFLVFELMPFLFIHDIVQEESCGSQKNKLTKLLFSPFIISLTLLTKWFSTLNWQSKQRDFT